jgi:hypothetical protein
MFLKSLKNSYNLLKQNPGLIFLGFLTSFLAINELQFTILNTNRIFQWNAIFEQIIFFKNNFSLIFENSLKNIFSANPGFVLSLIFGGVIFLFLFYITSLAQGLLIKKTFYPGIKFSEEFQKNNFAFKIFFLNIIQSIFNAIVFYCATIRYNIVEIPFGYALSVILISLALIYLFALLTRWMLYLFAVTETKFFPAFIKGTSLLFRSLLPSLTTSLIILAANIAIALFFVLFSQSLFFFSALVSQSLAFLTGWSLFSWIFFYFSVGISLIIYIFLFSCFSAWQYLFWGNIFQNIFIKTSEQNVDNPAILNVETKK